MHVQISTDNKQLNIKHTVRCASDSDIEFTDWISILTKELETQQEEDSMVGGKKHVSTKEIVKIFTKSVTRNRKP